MQPAQHGALLVSLLLLLLLAGSILLLADYLLHPERFPVKRISFVGEFQQVSKAALQDEAQPFVGQNFFVTDLEQLEAALNGIDWVENASVSRVWPDTLRVTVQEQRLVARWNDDAWVTSSSTIVSLPVQSNDQLPRWEGPDGSQDLLRARHLQFVEQLAAAGMTPGTVRYSERGAWQIVARNAQRDELVTIHLGRRDISERLRRFVHAYRDNLSHQRARLQMVDLRYPNGFALKWQASTQRRPEVTG
jgi:cell division protein FtsQ